MKSQVSWWFGIKHHKKNTKNKVNWIDNAVLNQKLVAFDKNCESSYSDKKSKFMSFVNVRHLNYHWVHTHWSLREIRRKNIYKIPFITRLLCDTSLEIFMTPANICHSVLYFMNNWKCIVFSYTNAKKMRFWMKIRRVISDCSTIQE